MAGLDPAIQVAGNRKSANNLMLSLTKHAVVAHISGGRVKTHPLDWKGAPVLRSEKTIRRARLMF